MKAKKFIIGTFLITVVLLLGCGISTAVIDPYFHFHKPLNSLEYPMIDNEYYYNAGIVKNFDYEAVIAGDSMTQNFKTSQAEKLWNLSFVKISNPGAPFRETDMTIRCALEHNSDLKLVIRQLDNYMFVRDAYAERYTKSDNYLWDDNPFNDVKYLFEKETFVAAFTVLTYTRAGKSTPTFDMYSNDSEYQIYGDKIGLENNFARNQDFYFAGEQDEVVEKALENIKVNVIQTALDNPDVDFVFFVPPYSGAYWKEIINAGVLENEIATEYAIFSELLDVPNISIYYFMDDFEITTDWSNYSDEIHFKPEINEYILDSMYTGKHLLTKDNFSERLENVRMFYISYDYDMMRDALDEQ